MPVIALNLAAVAPEVAPPAGRFPESVDPAKRLTAFAGVIWKTAEFVAR